MSLLSAAPAIQAHPAAAAAAAAAAGCGPTSPRRCKARAPPGPQRLAHPPNPPTPPPQPPSRPANGPNQSHPDPNLPGLTGLRESHLEGCPPPRQLGIRRKESKGSWRDGGGCLDEELRGVPCIMMTTLGLTRLDRNGCSPACRGMGDEPVERNLTFRRGSLVAGSHGTVTARILGHGRSLRSKPPWYGGLLCRCAAAQILRKVNARKTKGGAGETGLERGQGWSKGRESERVKETGRKRTPRQKSPHFAPTRKPACHGPARRRRRRRRPG